MRAPIVWILCAAVFSAGAAAQVQQQQQPVRVNPGPAVTPTKPVTPVAPATPAPSQHKLLVAPVAPVAPAAKPLSADAIRAVALQSAPPAGSTRAEQAELRQVSESLRKGDLGGAQEKWMRAVTHAVERDKKHKEWINLESFSDHVLHQAYLAPDEGLSRAAEKVRFYDEQDRALTAQRADLGRARQNLGATSTSTVTVNRIALSDNFETNRDAVEDAGTERISREELDEAIEKAEEQLRQIGEDAQLANVDLQNALQKQQQTLQTMSNVSKMLHDTAMATIRKIGG